MNKWIRVEDGLPPPDGEDVLVAYELRGERVVHFAAMHKREGGAAYWGSWDSEDIYPVDNVTHWQPLPEPPKD